jgi:hypothetical protein
MYGVSSKRHDRLDGYGKGVDSVKRFWINNGHGKSVLYWVRSAELLLFTDRTCRQRSWRAQTHPADSRHCGALPTTLPRTMIARTGSGIGRSVNLPFRSVHQTLGPQEGASSKIDPVPVQVKLELAAVHPTVPPPRPVRPDLVGHGSERAGRHQTAVLVRTETDAGPWQLPIHLLRPC